VLDAISGADRVWRRNGRWVGGETVAYALQESLFLLLVPDAALFRLPTLGGKFRSAAAGPRWDVLLAHAELLQQP
jgi:hypothetical protein